ncbi:MAG: hypothetical protein C0417_07295 [Chlorobiaceae bacterium]|nr:hypothetical protein [Chlorobiaceae bacterium]
MNEENTNTMARDVIGSDQTVDGLSEKQNAAEVKDGTNQTTLENSSTFWQKIKKLNFVWPNIINSVIALGTIFLACAAFKQLVIYEHATHIENTSYLVLGDIKPLQVTSDGKVQVEWFTRNIGKTPAYKVRQMTRFNLGEFTDGEVIAFRAPASDSGFVISPGSEYQKFSKSDPLSPEEMLRIGLGHLYVLIIVEYEDVFHRLRWTRGYIHYVPRDSTFYFMRKYNDTDRYDK